MLNNFRAYQLAVKFFHEAKKVPVTGNLKDQLSRASSSIVLNLAEGSAKFHNPKEQRRFYRIAFGNLRESQSILEIAESTDLELKALADRLGGHLYSLAK